MVYVMDTLVDSKSFEVFVEYQFGFIYPSSSPSTKVSGKSLHEAVVSLGLTRCLKWSRIFFVNLTREKTSRDVFEILWRPFFGAQRCCLEYKHSEIICMKILLDDGFFNQNFQ